MANLITAYEVKRYAPAGRDYPTVNICESIPQVEEEIGYKCLGEDLYEYLQSVLTPYPDTAEEYDPNTTYELDEVVIRHGCLFSSDVACNRTDPLEKDNDWSAVEKFTVECANTLWTKYLRRIIAFRVYESVVLFDTQQSGAAGVTVNLGDGYNTGNRAASKAELADRQKKLQDEANRAVENMYRWMKQQQEDGTCTVLPLESGIACWTRNCTQPRKGVRRWAFAH